MNLLLLDANDLTARGRAVLTGPRAHHVRSILRKTPGDTLRAGLLGGEIGLATIVADDAGRLTLALRLTEPPPAKRPVVVVLALPRPPVLRRLLQQVTAMGVEHIALLHTARVEKSYWQSPALERDRMQAQLRTGLEQARDTVPPRITTHRRFRPFVEDELPELARDARILVADPDASRPCPTDVEDRVVLVVGPEGGLLPFELELLSGIGASLISLGPRILRVETAVVALLGRLGLGST